MEGFALNASEASPLRSSRSRTTSSAERCSASAALPPLPKNTILPPARNAAAARFANSAIRSTNTPEKLCLTRALSDFSAVTQHAPRGVARIHHQLGGIHDRRVIVAGVIRGNDHRVVARK